MADRSSKASAMLKFFNPRPSSHPSDVAKCLAYTIQKDEAIKALKRKCHALESTVDQLETKNCKLINTNEKLNGKVIGLAITLPPAPPADDTSASLEDDTN
jgi:hypothetical protein